MTRRSVIHAGEKLGRLVAIKETYRIGKNGWKERYIYCKCECGEFTEVAVGSLRSKRTRSCGCLGRESRIKHGHTFNGKASPEFSSWACMIGRCTNSKNTAFNHYGGRGIKVCQRWMDSFSDFLSDMGDKPARNYELDRIDTNKDYFKENCQWISRAGNLRNTRRCKWWFVYGERFTSAQQAADRYSVGTTVIRAWCGAVKGHEHRKLKNCWCELKYKPG